MKHLLVLFLAILCSAVQAQNLQAAWTPMIYACISGHNMQGWRYVFSFKSCQLKCEATPGCKSVDYHKGLFICYTSRYTWETATNYFHRPCYTDQTYYQYAEIRELKQNWTPIKYACIRGHNIHEWKNVPNFKSCQMLCEATPGCQSVDYHKGIPLCYTSRYTSETASAYFNEPCALAPAEYQYAEITANVVAESECGISTFGSNRIVGGQDAAIGEWPWQVRYRITFPNQPGSYSSCGGTLIHKKWVLTAAHCTNDGAVVNEVILGDHDQQNMDSGEQRVKVKRIINHESYTSPKRNSYDFALLELETEAVITKTVRTICLPKKFQSDNTHFDNQACYISGWGTLAEGGEAATILQDAAVNVYQQQDCENAYTGSIDNSMVCAGVPQGGVDSCQGDSGGPLQCPVQESSTVRRWYLWGVTSFGRGCARPDFPGVYGRVTEIMGWIEQKTGISF